MEATMQEEAEDPAKPGGMGWIHSLVSRLDLPFLLVAAITGFLAANSDPWWSVQSGGSSAILQVSVSPFFVHIIGLGVPSTVPNGDVFGIIARVGLGATTVTLGWQAFFPLSAWRKTAMWLALSAIAGVFLDFVLLVHSTQIVLLQQYGVVPQLTGNTRIPGVVLGTDLVAYSNPTISSSLGLGLFAGLAGFVLLGGIEFARYIHSPRLGFGVPKFMTGLTGAFLSPPYQHAWLTSNDEGLNPLSKDPDRLTDDELALSFERLFKALRPGSTVSVILPPWALKLSNRLVRVVSWIGFELENSQVIFRAPGKPENELVFHKPALSEQASSEQNEPKDLKDESDQDETSNSIVSAIHPPYEFDRWGAENDIDNTLGSDDSLSSALHQPGQSRNIENLPVEEEIENSIWSQPVLDPAELAIVKSAVRVIENRGEPVLYDDLFDGVYDELTERKISFESIEQIQAVITDHAGREFDVYEQLDENGELVKAWWIGEGINGEATNASGLRAGLSRLGKRIWGQKTQSNVGQSIETQTKPDDEVNEESEDPEESDDLVNSEESEGLEESGDPEESEDRE